MTGRGALPRAGFRVKSVKIRWKCPSFFLCHARERRRRVTKNMKKDDSTMTFTICVLCNNQRREVDNLATQFR